MNIYVASSWRNNRYETVREVLLELEHTVYDFKDPETAFSWEEIDPNYNNWTAADFVKALQHPLAEAGHSADVDAVMRCDLLVLVLPCGRSAHLELGIAVGVKKKTIVLMDDPPSAPELMYRSVTSVVTNLEELRTVTGLIDSPTVRLRAASAAGS